MKRIGSTLLVCLALAAPASATPVEKQLAAHDPHPLTLHRAVKVAERLGYRAGEWRRGSDRVVHLHVYRLAEVQLFAETPPLNSLVESTLTVKLRKGGWISVYDSLGER